MTFAGWLRCRLGEPGPVGELARDAQRDLLLDHGGRPWDFSARSLRRRMLAQGGLEGPPGRGA